MQLPSGSAAHSGWTVKVTPALCPRRWNWGGLLSELLAQGQRARHSRFPKHPNILASLAQKKTSRQKARLPWKRLVKIPCSLLIIEFQPSEQLLLRAMEQRLRGSQCQDSWRSQQASAPPLSVRPTQSTPSPRGDAVCSRGQWAHA